MHMRMGIYMGQFGLFGLNGFKRGQTHFSHLHKSLDPDELESYNFVCRLITGLLKLHIWAVITVSVPKYTSNIDAYYTQICQIFI